MAWVAEGHESYLDRAKQLFSEAIDDPRLVTLRHYRNKFAAHLPQPDPKIPLPVIADLINFAARTAKVAEALAFAAGVNMNSIENQIDAYRDSADAYWKQFE